MGRPLNKKYFGNPVEENAIIIYAAITGTEAEPVACDIIRQVSTRRYKVTDGINVGIVQLGTDDTPAAGFGYIVATAIGSTYYVTKLTAHKATLVSKTGDAALNGMTVQWTLGEPTASIVQIASAATSLSPNV